MKTTPTLRSGGLLSALALAAAPAHAQLQWTKQAPLPSAGTITGVHPLSADDVWCSVAPYPSNGNGHVGHTTNAGLDWEVDELDTGGVTAIFFVDSQHGWTAGNAFRHTIDGGQTWITDNNWGSIADLFFLDTQRGWAAGNGGVAYRTVDGGLTWTGVTTPAGSNLSSIWFQDASNGWAVPINGNIVRTTDGGLSWTAVFNPGAYLSTVQFVSPTIGWAIGGNTFLRTVDGGTTWVQMSTPAGHWSHGARFFDIQHGVSVGDAGEILRTDNGGTSWTVARPAGSGALLWDVEYANANTIVASGGAGNLLRSTDGGITWAPIQDGAQGSVHDLDALGGTAWAANDGGEIARTDDGGRRWTRIPVTPIGLGGSVEGIDFVDPSIGWVVGQTSNTGGDLVIARSIDGGSTWTSRYVGGNEQARGIEAVDPSRAHVFGGVYGGGTLLSTSDGGANWTVGGPPLNTGFRAAHFRPGGQTGWLAGDGLYKTVDGGANWFQLSSPGSALWFGISFADDSNGWACGPLGRIARTTDGGASWVLQDAGAPSGVAFERVQAIDSLNAWVVGWSGFVAHTTDGGQTWVSEAIEGASSFASFDALAMTGPTTGWIGGGEGIWGRGGPMGCDQITNFCVSVPNSTFSAAVMDWSGSCQVSAGNLVLEAGPLPEQPFLFFFGPNQTIQNFGNGFRCVGGFLTRLQPPMPAIGGVATRNFDAGSHGLVPGQTMNFQCWFRDPLAGGAAFNLSDGLSVVFQ